MDGYSGKRVVDGLVVLGTGSGLISKNHPSHREQNAQFCNRIGCNGRPKSMKGTPNGCSDKAKSSRPFHRTSSNGKEILGSSSKVYSGVSKIRKSSTNSQRKLPTQLETDSSEASSVQGEPEVLELIPSAESIQRRVQLESEDSDSREATMMEVGSSSVASNPRLRENFTKRSGLGKQDTLASPSVTVAAQNFSQATCANSSRYGLRNLRRNSVSDVVPAGCSSNSSLSRRKDAVKKRNSDVESCSSTRGKKLSGSSLEGRNNSASCGVTISDSRRARNCLSKRESDVTSSVRTRRANSGYGRGTLPNQAIGNSLTMNESLDVMSQEPQSDIKPIDLNASVSAETSTIHASSYVQPDSISESLHGMMPSSPSEVGFNHSSVNQESFERYNMDGIAEVLLALERIEQDEELTYEQLLVLETSLFLNGLNFYDQHRDMRLDIDNMSYEELLALEERMGTVSTALSEEAMSKCLKRSIYEASSSKDANVKCEGENDDVKCSICQEEYIIGDEVGRLQCEHEYHVLCIQQWLRVKNWCPICKALAEPTQS